MSAPIGPGDWVECVDVAVYSRHLSRPDCHRYIRALAQLRVGAIYRIRALGRRETIFLHGVVAGDEPHLGWAVERFKPIFPGGELKRLLLEKPLEASPPEKVKADA